MNLELISYKNPKSTVSEAFRTLRTNIQFMNSKKDLKTILITSTVPGEGKSLVAANLAITFAQAGKKVALIDADMRKGRLHKIFSVDNEVGLSNYLFNVSIDNKKIDSIFEYLQPTIDNLNLITCGDFPPNPSELLSSEYTEQMIEKLKEKFDIIIFDSTPSILVTDAMILARLVDTTLIIAASNKTKKDDLVKVKRNLESVGASIAGVVLNKVQMNSKEYSKSYYYGRDSKEE